MQQQTISLGQFERAYGINKGTVSRKARELGFDTSAGLTPDAVEALKATFNVMAQLPELDVSEGTMTIHTGNHRGPLSLPSVPGEINLGSVRGDYAPLTGFEANDIDRFLTACDGFLEAVDQDYQQQLAITQRIEAGVQKVRAKVDEVRAAKLRYQLRSETIALHNRQLDTELQTGMGELGKLGGDGDDGGAS